MGRLAGLVAELAAVVRAVVELAALKRAFEHSRAPEERVGGSGRPWPAEPTPADVPDPEGRGDPAPASGPGSDRLGPAPPVHLD